MSITTLDDLLTRMDPLRVIAQLDFRRSEVMDDLARLVALRLRRHSAGIGLYQATTVHLIGGFAVQAGPINRFLTSADLQLEVIDYYDIARQRPDHRLNPVDGSKVASAILVPLRIAGTPIGAFYVSDDRVRNPITPEERAFVLAAANVCVRQIERRARVKLNLINIADLATERLARI